MKILGEELGEIGRWYIAYAAAADRLPDRVYFLAAAGSRGSIPPMSGCTTRSCGASPE